MFDKSFPLPTLYPVVLSGADAVRFAQAQFMNEVAALPVGQWQWNGWLTPKGRVMALFALVKRADEEVVVLLLDVEPAAFCSALGRFVFRSKVKLEPSPALSVLGRFAAPERARGSLVAEFGDGGLELDFGAEGGARTLVLTAVDDSPASGDPLPQPLSHQWERGAGAPLPLAGEGLGRGPGGGKDVGMLLNTWHRFDLAHGLPRLLPGQTEHWTPQQLSLNRLNAYSVKKGCYPGQEIVARTHFLGQAKRGLVRLAADHAIEPETGVQVDEAPPVPLVSCSGHDALAVLALDAAPDARYRIDDQPVRREALLDGLAR